MSKMKRVFKFNGRIVPMEEKYGQQYRKKMADLMPGCRAGI